jgi:hypothetical protein
MIICSMSERRKEDLFDERIERQVKKEEVERV